MRELRWCAGEGCEGVAPSVLGSGEPAVLAVSL